MNPYFNCSSPAFEACAVPYSCCTEDMRVNEFGNTNTRCGHGVLKASNTVSSRLLMTKKRYLCFHLAT